MPFTFQEILTAVLGSAGVIGGVIALATFITARMDARAKRKELEISTSAEMQRVKLENERFGAGVWESVAREREAEIRELKAENARLREMVGVARTTLTDAERTLDGLKVAEVPNEVVAVIQRKIGQVRAVLVNGKDKLG